MYSFIVTVTDSGTSVSASLVVKIEVVSLCSQANGLSLSIVEPLPDDVLDAHISEKPHEINLSKYFATSGVVSCPIDSYSCTFVNDDTDCSSQGSG